MSVLFDHPLWAFLVWTLLAVGFGIVIGQCMSDADKRAEAERAEHDTAVLDWNSAPAEWRL